MEGITYDLGGMGVSGWSVASLATAFHIPKAGLMMDIGWFSSEMIESTEFLFVSHLHPDHWSALVGFLFQRYLLRQPIKLIIPSMQAAEWNHLLTALVQSSGLDLPYRIIPLDPGYALSLSPGYDLTGYVMRHSRPTMGIIIRYLGRPWLGYTSDTAWEGILENPSFFEVPYLLTECTFMEPENEPDAIQHYHIHLSQISRNFYRFHNRMIYLVHLDRSLGSDRIQQCLTHYISMDNGNRLRIWMT
ncbi:MAG: hypothetical protein KBA26_08125 [Candidatus Delongbacteria bacterium]|nr:hypothetical protein [Candidatus Delongbacteria bacterium]